LLLDLLDFSVPGIAQHLRNGSNAVSSGGFGLSYRQKSYARWLPAVRQLLESEVFEKNSSTGSTLEMRSDGNGKGHSSLSENACCEWRSTR